MSYTNVELLGHHLISAFPTADLVCDQALTLEGTDSRSFFGAAVDGSSLRVKSLRTAQPVRQMVTLGAAETTISSLPIVPGSVVVASDSSLGTVFVENLDYIVRYGDGLLVIKEGGALSAGMTVTVWHLPYTLYESGSDYVADVDRGEIRRSGGGAIADGETVYLDFAPRYDSFDQAVLESAVSEANGTVEREVDPERQFGADPALQAAATYRALAVVCRTAATRELSGGGSDYRTASVWLELARDAAAQAEKYLAEFRAPVSAPSHPAHS